MDKYSYPMHIANLGSSMSYTIAYLGHACSLHIAIATQSIFQLLWLEALFVMYL